MTIWYSVNVELDSKEYEHELLEFLKHLIKNIPKFA